MIVDPIVVDCRLQTSRAAIDLIVPEDLHYFRGHFPGVPIVPGVVQIGWAITLARMYLHIAPAFRGMEAVKFQQVMLPGMRVALALEYVEASGKLRFSFGSESARYSSGRVLLDLLP